MGIVADLDGGQLQCLSKTVFAHLQLAHFELYHNVAHALISDFCNKLAIVDVAEILCHHFMSCTVYLVGQIALERVGIQSKYSEYVGSIYVVAVVATSSRRLPTFHICMGASFVQSDQDQ